MGRELQKRKRRSSRATVRQTNRPKKALNPRGNDLIAKNWNKKETLSQNYRRLGLVSRLNDPTGGTERPLHASAAAPAEPNAFGITPTGQSVVSEARVERDAAGRIVRVLSTSSTSTSAGYAPLADPLNALDSDSEKEQQEEEEEEEEEWGGIPDEHSESTRPWVVRQLERQARSARPAAPRHASAGEAEWVARLVAKHGEDTRAMARDRRLNPMQQTEADIVRRIRRVGG